ncbi:MAG: DUF4389 domain-containing protein [Proteobacteria bacterium]|jgi:hypothetical protein|nr:DUF4389 domain-containing protein [Pseudomonadota bacterium]MDA0976492.1 DUF4389 domain-containing protein [Pseudomonadota bacterium]MDA1083801.1 DUF4389 domain-containing protein [Pseudomonadota bacterium]MDC1242136.1 DUF4389 domain-containing protein [Gammaproteobacteria bacterium]
MNQIDIDKEEILKTSKWIRLLFMLLYGFAINFVLTICLGLAFIQFLFYLFTSKPNVSIANFNEHLIGFFSDSLAFLLFQTDEKPFPFKGNNDFQEEGEVIEGESEPEAEVTGETSEVADTSTQSDKD